MENLKQIREEKGFTQIEVAQMVGVSLAGYRLWETGGGKPTPDNLDKLKRVLEIEKEE